MCIMVKVDQAIGSIDRKPFQIYLSKYIFFSLKSNKYVLRQKMTYKCVLVNIKMVLNTFLIFIFNNYDNIHGLIFFYQNLINFFLELLNLETRKKHHALCTNIYGQILNPENLKTEQQQFFRCEFIFK